MEYVILAVGAGAVYAAWDGWRRFLANQLTLAQFDETLSERMTACERRVADVDAKAQKIANFVESQKAGVSRVRPMGR